MEELKYLVISAQNGDLDAFGTIIERFYDMARGCARSILADADLAEDAVQEAFINAYRAIGNLREPEAFPGWFHGVVKNSAMRFIRGKQLPTVTLDEITGIPSNTPDPAKMLEHSDSALLSRWLFTTGYRGPSHAAGDHSQQPAAFFPPAAPQGNGGYGAGIPDRTILALKARAQTTTTEIC